MDWRRFAEDDDAEFSETFAAGALVVITVLMALSAGVYVLAIDTTEKSLAAETNFTYDYTGNSDSLIIRYAEGGTHPATDLVVSSGRTSETWGTLAGMQVNATVEPGSAVQLSAGSPWGEAVTGVAKIRIHLVRNDTRTLVSNWSADSI